MVAPTTTTLVETGISASGQRSGPSTQASQLKLLELGFWLADPNGKFDDTTTQAVMRFRSTFNFDQLVVSMRQPPFCLNE